MSNRRLIDKKSLTKMLNAEPRRIAFAYNHRNALKRDEKQKYAGAFNIPFSETIKYIFEDDLDLKLFQNKQSKGALWRSVKNQAEYDKIERWIERQGTRVFLRDCLCLSVALDQNLPDRDSGKTCLGKLEEKAKHKQDSESIKKIIDAMCETIKDLPRYKECGYICAVPADGRKDFDLPTELAQKIATKLKLKNLTDCFSFAGKKKAVKESAREAKWDIWEGADLTISKCLGSVPSVILIDDKYQSGISINYVASRLIAAGVKNVFGLCVVKTLRDTDNQ